MSKKDHIYSKIKLRKKEIPFGFCEAETVQLNWSTERSIKSRQSETALLSRKSPNAPENCDTIDMTCRIMPTVDRMEPTNSGAGTFKLSNSDDFPQLAQVKIATTKRILEKVDAIYMKSDEIICSLIWRVRI